LVSTQGKVLAGAIVSGLFIGLVTYWVSFDGQPLTFALIQSNADVSHGHLWQLLTSLIVAPPPQLDGLGGVIDVLFNAAALIWLDGILFGAYDAAEYYSTFLLTGIAGNLLSLLNGPYQLSFGASGGIFGLLAGAVVEDFVVEGKFDMGLLAWFLLIFIFSSFALSYVDWLAHLGGALAGVLIGYYLGVARRNQAG
jgi:membrane associated rhomboid family serine protease